ncbi:MAG TPA: anthranilate phosphoribosyltransferase [Candidatus Methylacidiphilales bacterium]|jgi:anthranilate phosphoribosyltransferase|nr:anthranilate phosphoribosyltransferase [Candidatus Methylacidiphilales bacterium]
MLPDLTRAVPNRTLTPADISAAATDLLDPSVTDTVKADFLRAWAQRGETAAELAACAEAFLPKALDPGLRGSWRGKPLLDCCGTGGGGLNVVNISTGLMFVLAAMGIPVVKHGNRGITKRSGSADVLEAMGIRIDLAPEEVPRCLEEIGCAFLFAPAYHTTFAVIAPVRKALAAEGQRTAFNLIGPLLNPARPDARLVGVFSRENVALYRDALTLMKCPRFTVVCGEDVESGKMIGEASAQGANLFGSTLPLTELTRTPGYEPHEHIDSLLVRNADESASRIETILSGEDQELAHDTLLLNAAIASWTHGSASSLEEGLDQAAQALDSGAALEKLRAWQRFSE